MSTGEKNEKIFCDPVHPHVVLCLRNAAQIVSQKDEHCWVGELNGLRGWFPAKFVSLLDERVRDYSVAGDDAAMPTVAHLVRGTLASALRRLFDAGLKRPPFGSTLRSGGGALGALLPLPQVRSVVPRCRGVCCAFFPITITITIAHCRTASPMHSTSAYTLV